MRISLPKRRAQQITGQGSVGDDEAKHRREMGLPPSVQDNQAAELPLEIEMDLVDDVDLPDELDNDGLVARESA